MFCLSKRLKEALLDAAVAGDGTIRNCGHNSIIYYSSSKFLANDIQELAMSCGFETSLYGPYKYEDRKGTMYQVHINKNAPRIRELVRSKKCEKSYSTKPKICLLFCSKWDAYYKKEWSYWYSS